MLGKGDVGNNAGRVRLGQDHRSPKSQLGRISHLDSEGNKEPLLGFSSGTTLPVF